MIFEVPSTNVNGEEPGDRVNRSFLLGIEEASKEGGLRRFEKMAVSPVSLVDKW